MSREMQKSQVAAAAVVDVIIAEAKANVGELLLEKEHLCLFLLPVDNIKCVLNVFETLARNTNITTTTTTTTTTTKDT